MRTEAEINARIVLLMKMRDDYMQRYKENGDLTILKCAQSYDDRLHTLLWVLQEPEKKP